ncbi:MAG: hypothetical protein ACI9R3_001009 [Verrucomicrobiales bacterium]|jgi:hypothetical protein
MSVVPSPDPIRWETRRRNRGSRRAMTVRWTSGRLYRESHPRRCPTPGRSRVSRDPGFPKKARWETRRRESPGSRPDRSRLRSHCRSGSDQTMRRWDWAGCLRQRRSSHPTGTKRKFRRNWPASIKDQRSRCRVRIGPCDMAVVGLRLFFTSTINNDDTRCHYDTNSKFEIWRRIYGAGGAGDGGGSGTTSPHSAHWMSLISSNVR